MKHCFCSKKKISFAIHIINVKSLKKDNKSVSYSLIMVNRQLLCSSFLCSQIRFTSHYKTLPFEVLEKNRGKRKQSIHSYNKNKPQQETRGNDWQEESSKKVLNYIYTQMVNYVHTYLQSLVALLIFRIVSLEMVFKTID